MWTRRQTIIGACAAITGSAIATPAWACPKTVRIIVSLADNKHQGIVPTTATLGNGQNPDSNLYWGAKYGLRTYLKQHPEYQVTRAKLSDQTDSAILERLDIAPGGGFPAIRAEAWNGAHQKAAVKSFFKALDAPQDDLLIFVGHNPLMDLPLTGPFTSAKGAAYNAERKVAVVACQSQKYFGPIIERMGYQPYLLTAGNMAPEAYVVEAILSAWQDQQPAAVARQRAAEAYSKYQKIPLKNSNWLFDA